MCDHLYVVSTYVHGDKILEHFMVIHSLIVNYVPRILLHRSPTYIQHSDSNVMYSIRFWFLVSVAVAFDRGLKVLKTIFCNVQRC